LDGVHCVYYACNPAETATNHALNDNEPGLDQYNTAAPQAVHQYKQDIGMYAVTKTIPFLELCSLANAMQRSPAISLVHPSVTRWYCELNNQAKITKSSPRVTR